jgi:exosome complex component RRP4
MAEIREIVLPGQLIEDRKGRKIGKGVYLEEDNIFAKVLGTLRNGEDEVSVIPLSGVYQPAVGDKIVGSIKDLAISGWMVDINSPYIGFLPLSEAVAEFVDTMKTDLSRYFDLGDIIYCKVSRVTKDKNVQVSMRVIGSRKLFGGIAIEVTPSKIPRIIGKAGSMISLLKEKTGCEIVAGQNGMVWIKGVNKAKAIEAILTIERESHIIGLTEKIVRMLGG